MRRIILLAIGLSLAVACSERSGSTLPPLTSPTFDAQAEKARFLEQNCDTETGPGSVPSLTSVEALLFVPNDEQAFPNYYLMVVTHGFPNDGGNYRIDYHDFEGIDSVKAIDSGLVTRESLGYRWGDSTLLEGRWLTTHSGNHPTWGQVACDLAYWYLNNAPHGFLREGGE